MLLLIDNYDSFTYNLADYFCQLGYRPCLIKHDQWSLQQIIASNPQALVISPGPGTPDQAGISLAAINALAGKIPILGVCLGHQAIAQAFGGNIIRAPQPMHGKTSLIEHDGKTLFQQQSNPLQVARYHSLIVDPVSLPAELMITAQTTDGIIMGLRHRHLPIEGVQFHPEAIQTQYGLQLLANFIDCYL